MKKGLLTGSVAVSLLLIAVVMIPDGDANLPEVTPTLAPLAADKKPTRQLPPPVILTPESDAASTATHQITPNDAPNPVTFTLASEDVVDPRERMGLPPVMKAIRIGNDYRPPTKVEKADPILMQRYLLERRIHAAYWTVRQDLDEVGRFRKDAARATEESKRDFLLKVAVQYAALAEKHKKAHAELEQQRMLYQ